MQRQVDRVFPSTKEHLDQGLTRTEFYAAVAMHAMLTRASATEDSHRQVAQKAFDMAREMDDAGPNFRAR